MAQLLGCGNTSDYRPLYAQLQEIEKEGRRRKIRTRLFRQDENVNVQIVGIGIQLNRLVVDDRQRQRNGAARIDSGIRDIAVIGLMYVCGLRRADIAQRVVSDFDQSEPGRSFKFPDNIAL